MKDRSRPPRAGTSRLTDRLARIGVPCALGLWASGAAAEACPSDVAGVLAGPLRGAIEADLDWHGDGLQCQGMRRPGDPAGDSNGNGGRLWFRGDLSPGQPLIVVIGIDGLAPGVTGEGLDANFTLVVEQGGGFYSSRGQSGCWADVETNEPLECGGHAVGGIVYCMRAIGEVGGSGAVSVPELRFRGWLKPAEDADTTTAGAHRT